MPARLSGKQRAARIPLDYYKKRDRLGRWKLGLSAIGLVVAIGWFASGFSWGGPGGWRLRESDRGRLKYSHGPLARVHAIWDAKCDACHTPFTSIEGEKWAGSVGLKAGNPDERCLKCHKVADHSKNMKPEEIESCGSCHRDHRGREASLVDIANASCINCHGNLEEHSTSKSLSKGLATQVSAFPAGHPEFTPFGDEGDLAKDPGTIKFSHALHMTPGLNEAKDGKPVFTWEQLSASDRSKYGYKEQKLTDGVAMQCTSCHRLDDAGAYYEPIKYERHCKSCHKLDVVFALGLERGVPKTATVSVPHALQPAQVETFVHNAAIGVAVKRKENPADFPPPKQPVKPMPGHPADVLFDVLPESRGIATRFESAKKMLFTGAKATCNECHHYQSSEGTTALPPPKVPLSAVTIKPPGMNQIWFKNARFVHAEHRGVSCASCHDAAYPSSKNPSRSSETVMLVGKATCAQCHASETTTSAGLPTGGAGNSCVECHKYHGGGHGGAKLSPDDGRTIEAFLKGESN